MEVTGFRDDERRDHIDELAAQLGVAPDLLAAVVGPGWDRVPRQVPSGTGTDDDGWFVSGEPLQVMLRVRSGAVQVALPDVEWHGPGTPVIVPRLVRAELPVAGLDLEAL